MPRRISNILSSRVLMGRTVIPRAVLVLAFCGAFLAQGCSAMKAGPQPSTRSQVMRAYLAGVEKADGISREEALLLAQSHLIFHGSDDRFYLDQPQVRDDDKQWSVFFAPRPKTIDEVISCHGATIIVAKNDGRVTWIEE